MKQKPKPNPGLIGAQDESELMEDALRKKRMKLAQSKLGLLQEQENPQDENTNAQ